MKAISGYQTFIIDCDGVILDSNTLKTDAFREALANYPTDATDQFIDYHKRNGGVSRYQKFEYFFKDMLGIEDFQAELESTLKRYAATVSSALLTCPETTGLRDFLEYAREKASRRFVLSGSDQTELRNVFKKRGLHKYFDDILGSPEPKQSHLARMHQTKLIEPPALLIGDGKADHDAAHAAQIDFAYVYGFSESEAWEFDHVRFRVRDLSELLRAEVET